MQIYVFVDGQQTGPFTEEQVRAQLNAGTITPETLVWWEGMADWQPLGQTSLQTDTGAPAVPVAPAPMAAAAPITYESASAPEGTSGLAITSLITGILGFICDPVLAIAAVVTGPIARAQIRKNPNLKGSGLALTGLIFGYFWIVVFIAVMIFYIMMGPKILEEIQKIQQQQQAAMETNTPATNAPSQ